MGKYLGSKLTNNQTMILSGWFTNHKKVVASGLYDVFSNHTEEDTTVVYHLVSWYRYISHGYPLSTIFSIYIWFKTGNKALKWYTPLHIIVQKVGNEAVSLLIPVCTLTAWNSTSCFKGRQEKESSLFGHKWSPVSLNQPIWLKHWCLKMTWLIFVRNSYVDFTSLHKRHRFTVKSLNAPQSNVSV